MGVILLYRGAVGNRVIIYFSNKLANHSKNSNCIKHFEIELDDFRFNGKKNKLRGNFWKLLDELRNLIC